MWRAPLVAFAAVIVLAGCGDSGSDSSPGSSSPSADRVEVAVGDATVEAEIADDDSERARGLGGRDRLAPDAGMYFVLTDSSPRIWMKGMRFPLDLVWINGGRVVQVTPRVPDEPPGTPDAQLPIYSPTRPANRVLEVNAGWVERNGVRRGDTVRLENPAAG
jgi:uncharacterized membrane protein (UPF0127 family)